MPKPLIESPHYPIIYVRGFAGSGAEIDDTVADPYMGFNVGATKFRQGWDGAIRRHYFESPLYRLVKDYGYSDVYTDGTYMPPHAEIPAKSVIIYRYYDEEFFEDVTTGGEESAVTGGRKTIEEFAGGLGRLILAVRDRVCGDDAAARQAFRVHLVAHSMGGLIARCLLQNSEVGPPEAVKLVDKVFTYGTPHNGIEMSLLGNVPGFFTARDADNFNRERMAEYLGLPEWSEEAGRADNLVGAFDPDRFFCLVGTNHQDYAVAYGWSRRLVGPASDGLVRIKNAAVHSQETKGSPRRQAPRAFVNRAHSGHFGIVNSEEGYQNLARFLFGDVRVDGVLEVDELSLPPSVAKARKDGKSVKASYHFETVVRVRGARYDLHRRTAQEGSAVFRSFPSMFPDSGKPRHPHLFSTFLSRDGRVNKQRASLGFKVSLGVRVPEYEVDGLLWDKHYDGGDLYRDSLTIEATPNAEAVGGFKVRYGFDSKTPNRATRVAEGIALAGAEGVLFRIPIDSKTRPGFVGTLLLTACPWW